jgi:molybdopterin-guanine dinucleotide biosynthesis protein A
MPPERLRTLVYRAQTAGAPVTLFSCNGFVESFPVVLRRAAYEPLRDALASAECGCLRGFRRAAEKLGESLLVLPAEDDALARPGPPAPDLWFLNVNRPEDFRRAAQHISALIP